MATLLLDPDVAHVRRGQLRLGASFSIGIIDVTIGVVVVAIALTIVVIIIFMLFITSKQDIAVGLLTSHDPKN